MRISKTKFSAICKRQNLSVSALLKNAGVSRNAFYSLVRKPSLVPRSLQAMAETLNVPVADLLMDTPGPIEHMRMLNEQAVKVASRHSDSDVDNIRHTLILLEEAPVERLRRALRRGRQINIRKT